MQYKIPFNKPYLTGDELDFVGKSLNSQHLCGDGEFTSRCQQLLEEKLGAGKILLTTSGTSALEMCSVLCEIEPGDEVILPSYTFVSTVNAFILRGAKPVFVDIRNDTLNMDETLLESLITERTKCIVPVHYAGISCDMGKILDISCKHGVTVVEDAAQGVNAKYREKYLGTMGKFGVFSFHETKNFMCGEGGAVVVNDSAYLERAEIIREKGTNRKQFSRGEVSRYTWVDIGSSYLIADALAAILLAQLMNMEQITAKRKKIYDTYQNALKPLEEKGYMKLPVVPPECEPNYHMFYIILNDPQVRTDLIKHLQTKSILAVFHYIPLHTSPMGTELGYREGMLPRTEYISERILRLPMYAGLSNLEAMEVCNEISRFFAEQ